MVQSKVVENANFGRSLFERLTKLGKERHLLNAQYRMHPSISQFPNEEFYQKKISDAANVTLPSYNKQFLQGRMYSSYSFINISSGKEDFEKGHSPRNLAEVAAAAELVSRLQKANFYRYFYTSGVSLIVLVFWESMATFLVFLLLAVIIERKDKWRLLEAKDIIPSSLSSLFK